MLLPGFVGIGVGRNVKVAVKKRLVRRRVVVKEGRRGIWGIGVVLEVR